MQHVSHPFPLTHHCTGCTNECTLVPGSRIGGALAVCLQKMCSFNTRQPLWKMCHVWRTSRSSLATDSILNEAGVCELLKRLSSFSAPSPLSLFRSHFSHTRSYPPLPLPSFLFRSLSLLLDKREGGLALFVNQ